MFVMFISIAFPLWTQSYDGYHGENVKIIYFTRSDGRTVVVAS